MTVDSRYCYLILTRMSKFNAHKLSVRTGLTPDAVVKQIQRMTERNPDFGVRTTGGASAPAIKITDRKSFQSKYRRSAPKTPTGVSKPRPKPRVSRLGKIGSKKSKVEKAESDISVSGEEEDGGGADRLKEHIDRVVSSGAAVGSTSNINDQVVNTNSDDDQKNMIAARKSGQRGQMYKKKIFDDEDDDEEL